MGIGNANQRRRRKKLPTKDGKLFGKKLKRLRTDRGMTQSELADKVNYMLGEKNKYKTVNISSWERGSIPRGNALSCLAEIFNVTISELRNEGVPRVNDFFQIVQENTLEGAKEIVIEDLKMLSGQPVWIEADGESHIGCYGLVGHNGKTVVFPNGRSIWTKALDGKIYRFPNPMVSWNTLVGGTPLPLNKAKTMKQVFIIAVGSDTVKARFNGWYKFDKKIESFVKKGNPSITLSENHYELEYYAFEKSYE